MGYIKHDTIVVTSWEDAARFAIVHAKASDLLGAKGEEGRRSLVSEIVGSYANGQQSFFIAPDGSKEGWDASTAAEEGRDAFLSWLASQTRCYCTALVARFGGDDEELSVRIVEGQRAND